MSALTVRVGVVTYAVGDELPTLDKTMSRPAMIAYAGATWDWHRLHHDPEYLAARGLSAPVVDGQVFGAFLAEQLQDAFGPTAWVRALNFRFKKLVFAGETVRCHATITDITAEADAVVVHVDSWVEVLGEPARVGVAPAGGEVVIRP